MATVCSKCNAPAGPGATFCDNCGNRLDAGMQGMGGGAAPAGTRCPSCGSSATPGQAFCDSCGVALNVASASAPTIVQSYTPTPPAYNPPASVYNPPVPAKANNCPNCQSPVMPGSAFCDNCGASLAMPGPVSAIPPNAPTIVEPSGGYQPVQQPPPVYPPVQQPPPVYPPVQQPPPVYQPVQQPPPVYQPVQQPPPVYPPVQPPPQARIMPRLVVNATNAPLTVPAGKSEVLIGREDAVSNHFPDIDLGPHGGEEGGVGRRHAKLHIRGGQCFLEDLQSVNYTFVNRQKLTPGTQQPLNDGDELRFGRVLVRFYTN